MARNSKGGSNLSSRVANSNPNAGNGRFEDTAQAAQNAQLKSDISARQASIARALKSAGGDNGSSSGTDYSVWI